MSNQHSKCDNCYKSHLPETHDRTILPSEAFSEGYVPEFNQASEDELSNALDMLTIVEYDTGYGGLRHIKHKIVGKRKARAAIEAIIRAEKLKLLAEVRERVVGEDEDRNHRYNKNWKLEVDAQNYLRKEQRVELTKLEAEL